MTKLNIKFILSIVAITVVSVIIGLGISAISKTNKLNDEIEYLNSRIRQAESENNSTQSQLDNLENYIKQQLEEQSRNYYDASYSIKEISKENKTAVIEVYFSLKESPLSSDVEVSYGSGNQFDETVATKLANGKYMAEIIVQLDKDYEISYSAALLSVKTEKMLDINIMRQLKNRFSVSSGFTCESRGEWKIYFELFNSFYGYGIPSIDNNDNFKIATATLEVFRNNVLVKTINIKNYKIGSGTTYEDYGSKTIQISELTDDDFKDNKVSTKITIVDNFGMEYTFGSVGK